MGAALAPGGLGDFQGSKGDDFDAEALEAALGRWCRPLCLECSKPFLVKWYNEVRGDTAGGSQRIDAPDSAVCFALYSVPGFLEIVADYFRRIRPASGYVDGATDEILARLRDELHPSLDALVVNTDVGPPYYHVQTVGAVAGVDQHVEVEDFKDAEADSWREELSDNLEETRDTKMWGTDPATLRKVFGVNIHPEWGGWYAYRALIVLKGALAERLPQPEPMRFLEPVEARRIIAEYNLRHQECLWRDLSSTGHPSEKRYTTDEYLFFTETSPAKRRRWLEMRVAQMERAEACSSRRIPCFTQR